MDQFETKVSQFQTNYESKQCLFTSKAGPTFNLCQNDGARPKTVFEILSTTKNLLPLNYAKL